MEWCLEGQFHKRFSIFSASDEGEVVETLADLNNRDKNLG